VAPGSLARLDPDDLADRFWTLAAAGGTPEVVVPT
jgi:hypothetical protein